MTKKEQRTFVRNLCKSVAEGLIKEYEFPADWDGHELRVLIADTFAREGAPRHTATRAERLGELRRLRRIRIAIANCGRR